MRFASRSLLVLLLLYGAVFVLGDLALLHAQVPLWGGIVFAVAVIGIQYLVSPWIIEWVYAIGWYEDDIPAANVEFVRELCKQRGLPMPRMGIIESGTPNAFAFGRTRGDARIVVTRGLLNVCTVDEANAVLAHELGHIAHYDFAVMAVAALAPLLLWQIYIWTDRLNNQGRLVSYAAYVMYWISQFLVLLLNRTREYGADHFSAETTKAPNLLSSALVKIAYGMVRERGELTERMTSKDKDTKKGAKRALQAGQALGLMGIASASGGDALALGVNSPEDAARVMKWDLVNPWSRVYELGSTHPLTAMRLRALNKEASAFGQQVEYPLPSDTRVRWGGFPIEFLFWALPLVCGFLVVSWLWIGKPLRELGVHPPANAVSWLFVVLGVSWAARIMFRYHGSFQPATTLALLEDLEVSQMRPRAVVMEGEVIGHGIPGAYWSADLVLQDESGMMFLMYRSSVPFGRLFFALSKADRLIGEKVRVEGWYRRGIKPYVEISKIESDITKYKMDGNAPLSLMSTASQNATSEVEHIVQRSYSRWLQLAGAAVCTVCGVLAVLGSM